MAPSGDTANTKPANRVDVTVRRLHGGSCFYGGEINIPYDPRLEGIVAKDELERTVDNINAQLAQTKCGCCDEENFDPIVKDGMASIKLLNQQVKVEVERTWSNLVCQFVLPPGTNPAYQRNNTKHVVTTQPMARAPTATSTTSLHPGSTAVATPTDAFLTHEWGEGPQHETHHIVSKINAELKLNGVQTWFDEDRMRGNIVEQMADGIDNAGCVVVFITRRYMLKLQSEETDNCKMEFEHAHRRKTVKYMIPVVLDPDMKNPAEWEGPLGIVLGGQLYVDMSTPSLRTTNLPDLVQKIGRANM